MTFTDEERDYIAEQPLARIATVGDDGQPDVTPVTFEFDGTHFVVGGFRPTHTRRSRNVRAGHERVALVIDDLMSRDPWTPRFLRVYGTAELVPREGDEVLRITPVTSWSSNLDGAWSPGSGGPDAVHKTEHKTGHETGHKTGH